MAFHGGAFFDAIGAGFEALDRHVGVISADVLDAWYDPSPRVIEQVRGHLPFLLRTSPPISASGLVAAIARDRDVDPDWILPGAGSSDLIFRCLPRLIAPGAKVLLLDPMYSEYRHVCRTVIGAKVIEFRLREKDGFAADPAALLETAIGAAPDWVILVNPNSPTGHHIPRREVITLLEALPRQTRLVVDEAYVDYVGEGEALPPHPRLVVIKTLSKTLALSGARVAYLMAEPDAVRELALISPPWGVSLVAQVAAVAALGDRCYYREQYGETHRLRAEIIAEAACLQGVRALDTELNFYLLQLTDPALSATTLVADLRRRNIFVRNCDTFSAAFGDRYLRIAVKCREQNRRIVAALGEAIQVRGPAILPR